jgi:hypothetical protein
VKSVKFPFCENDAWRHIWPINPDQTDANFKELDEELKRVWRLLTNLQAGTGIYPSGDGPPIPPTSLLARVQAIESHMVPQTEIDGYEKLQGRVQTLEAAGIVSKLIDSGFVYNDDLRKTVAAILDGAEVEPILRFSDRPAFSPRQHEELKKKAVDAAVKAAVEANNKRAVAWMGLWTNNPDVQWSTMTDHILNNDPAPEK